MTFSEAVKTCLVEKYATFSGRATRSEFWFFCLFYFLLLFFVTLLMTVINETALIGFILALVLGLIIPSWAVSFRRLHDTGRSGWWCLLSFIPYIGSFILLIIFCLKSDNDNKYGPKPKSRIIER